MAVLRVAIPILTQDIKNYYEALHGLGAAPVIISPKDHRGEGMESILPADYRPWDFDALLLPGGADILPSRYHQERAGSVGGSEVLDDLQFGILEDFVKAQKPVFGICRGHQLINVFFGGSLIQHLPTYEDHARDYPPALNPDKVHEVTASDWLEDLYGERFFTNSSHHQAVDVLGRGLVIDAHCVKDGVVEALHHESLPIHSVQWHPERMCFAHARKDTVDGSLVLKLFLEECRH